MRSMHHAARRPAPAKPTSRFPSAARLAAEALFSGREPARPEAPTAAVPVVVVRKRSAVTAAAPASAEAGDAHAGHPPPQALPFERAPRVFTLRPTAKPDAEAATQSAASPESGAAAPAPAPKDEPGARRTKRSERIGHDTRARVIRVVTRVSGEAPDERLALEALEPDHAAPPPNASDETETPAALWRQFARIEALFEQIRQAREFTLVDGRAAKEWLHLTRRLERMAHEVEALGVHGRAA